jgi:hypothetical protein
MKINTKYLQKVIKEEAAALLAEEKMYQIGGPEYRAQTGVATPAEKFGIAAKDILKGLDTRSIWSMANKGHYKGDSGAFRKQGRAMEHLLGIIKSYRKADEPAVFAQSGYDTNMVPGLAGHSSFDLSKLPAERSDRYATIKKLIATIQKLEAAAAKTAEKPAEPNPETQPALGQDVAVNEGAESNAGAVIAMVLANKRLMKLLGPEAKSIISAVKEGGQLSLLVNLCTNGLVCPDGSDATDRHNRPRCKRTKLNPELDKNLLLTTLEKIKNFESDQAGDARAAEMSLMHGLEEGAVPGEISAEDLTAAITLAIDEVFQEHRPNREAAAEAYDNIMESIDAIFRESYAASVRASKMMGAEAGFEDLDV